MESTLFHFQYIRFPCGMSCAARFCDLDTEEDTHTGRILLDLRNYMICEWKTTVVINSCVISNCEGLASFDCKPHSQLMYYLCSIWPVDCYVHTFTWRRWGSTACHEAIFPNERKAKATEGPVDPAICLSCWLMRDDCLLFKVKFTRQQNSFKLRHDQLRRRHTSLCALISSWRV